MSRFVIRLDDRGLDPPAPRRAFNLALMIVCAVAAVSFTLGLAR
jgi:hypothetical protein